MLHYFLTASASPRPGSELPHLASAPSILPRSRPEARENIADKYIFSIFLEYPLDGEICIVFMSKCIAIPDLSAYIYIIDLYYIRWST